MLPDKCGMAKCPDNRKSPDPDVCEFGKEGLCDYPYSSGLKSGKATTEIPESAAHISKVYEGIGIFL